MSKEVETKVLEIDTEAVIKKLDELGAQQVLNTRYVVDWYRPAGIEEGEEEWYLRIRTDADDKSTVTWKAKSDIHETARSHKEIDFVIPEPDKLDDLFKELDLECYAHQEKDRRSWVLKDWRFDLDDYPKTPAFIEVEGESDTHVQGGIALLGLEENDTWPHGERRLIDEVYGLDWYDMSF